MSGNYSMEDIERTPETTEQAEPEMQPEEEKPEEGRKPGRRRRPRKQKERKMIGFRKLAFEAMPEIMSYMFMAAVILTGASALGSLIISKLLEENGIFAITTANVKDFVSSWRILPILLVAAVLLLLNLILGVFGSIYQCDDILKGGKVTFIEIFRESFKDLKRFLNLSGFLVILYMVLGVPIVGFGFQVDMTQNLVIPNFILSVILSKWYLAAGYYALIIFLIWKGLRHFFTLHGILLDDLQPKAAKKQSEQIVKDHWKELLLTAAIIFALGYALQFLVAYVVFPRLTDSLRDFGLTVPQGYTLDPNADLTELDVDVVINRTLAFFYVIVERLVLAAVDLLESGFVVLKATQLYRKYTGGTSAPYPERPWIVKYIFRTLSTGVLATAVLVTSFFLALYFDVYAADPVDPYIVAHRAGGYLASENSNEGLEAAIAAGADASEIDVQRTKDNRYVINHDRTFKRLAGEPRAAQEMTFDEVMALRIPDTSGSGREVRVATMEQMLDTIKGRHKLFIELKGATADRQMADDLVQMIREKDCLDDIVLIGLNFEVLKYAKETYPEFETGVLLFAGFGDIQSMNCDYVMLSQESATPARIRKVREQGKNAVVWTVNDEESLYGFLDGQADYVLTDDVELALQIQQELRERTEIERIIDFAAVLAPQEVLSWAK